MSKECILNNIKKAVIDMDEDEVRKLCKEALNDDILAYEILTRGLTQGMNEVVRLFEEGQYFLPEVLICSDAFNIGLEVINPHIDKDENKKSITIVIGVVEGDTHHMGKNLVKILMETRGIKVYDLGRDVPLKRFIEKAEEIDADIIAMSTLMTTTMEEMRRLIDLLKEKGLREKYKVMIGGGPVSELYAESIGADLYTKNAVEAAIKVKKLFESTTRQK